MSIAPLKGRTVRRRVRVIGTVQGVGFRPYVYRLAEEIGLTGFVLNDCRGVLIEIEGPEEAVNEFHARLEPESPPLALLEAVRTDDVAPTGTSGFSIKQSRQDAGPQAPVTPDSATCQDCLRELLDPNDRRYRYPFINCTNCGPRFTIVRGVPYDRPLTTMAGFTMCPACRTEYEDPANRRFHAQPNACPHCGPTLRLLQADGSPCPGTSDDPIASAAEAIRRGAIVAIKGLGGYHLACRAEDEAAVARLRARKHRDEKPFALMAQDIEMAGNLVELVPEAQALLCSPIRPIVLAPRRPEAAVAAGVAPGAPELGLMLPYTPVHHLLLSDLGEPVVMTSGNVSDEPICFRDGDALERLGGLVDLFLIGDRPIQTRTDDSVIRMANLPGRRHPLLLRRARGFVPASIPLPVQAPPLLACGAELKNTFCLASGRRAWVSHHIGDLKNWETLRSFQEGIAHFQELFGVDPAVLVHDLHPDYLSTRLAGELGDHQLAVQHHHAHLAACLAEHGHLGPAVGVIYDGSGYGQDGTVWGGELLVGDLAGYERAGHLRPVRLPGGDRAVQEPWRMACAWLREAQGAEAELPSTMARSVDERDWNAVGSVLASGLHAPLTSSVGRLFDAVAALCGIRSRISYEGQAAAELEAVADRRETGHYPLPVTGDLQLDARELISAVYEDVQRGLEPSRISARFHRALARATARACRTIAEASGTDTAALAGGVFQNRLLLELTVIRLHREGLTVLVPERLPPNDGAISYGQAAVAAARLAGAA